MSWPRNWPLRFNLTSVSEFMVLGLELVTVFKIDVYATCNVLNIKPDSCWEMKACICPIVKQI